jgi:glucose-1-phosphate thymidylyltransferase
LKGIILAGGSGTRLFPITKVISKQLLPVYDKPLIYYPLSVLMLAGIQDILIITTPEDSSSFEKLLGDGSHWGIKLQYAVQEKPEGLAQAFIIGDRFIGSDNVCLILGDNIFFGQGFSAILREAVLKQKHGGCQLFAYRVKDPERFGVVEIDNEYNAVSLEEKPEHPRSHWAVTGLYFYGPEVVTYAKELEPSDRGELEITDLNRVYLEQHQTQVKLLGRGFTWLDTGTHESLLQAGQFVETIETRQGLKIACVEEIAFQQNWISEDQLLDLAKALGKTGYAKYLKDLVTNS